MRTGGAAPPPPACPDPGRSGPVQPQSFASLRVPLGVPLRAGGAARIADCQGLPGTGYADAAPQLSLDLSQVPAGGSLDIAARADCDTVLLVRDPLGRWNFSDDRDGLNPGLTLEPAVAGRYGIWLGTYGPTACEATLMLSALGGEIDKTPQTRPGAAQVPPQTLDFGAGVGGWRGDNTSLSRILGGPDGGFVMNALSAGDGRVGYAVAPPALHGDWRGLGGVQVVMRTAPGQYFGAFSEGAVGDIVLRNGAMTAAAAFPEWVGADWARRSIPFRQAVLQDGQRRWRLSGGAQSLEDVLANVTDFRIRVEFMVGDTTAGLAQVVLTPGADGPPDDARPDVLPDPGNLSGFRDRVGQTLRFAVTGAAGGAVWGDEVYTDDSSLARAAVHAGALRVGEAGVVQVTILPGRSSYPASTRNGVQTGSWGAWSGSYSIARRGADAGGAPVPTAYAQPRVRGERVDWCVTWGTDCGQPGADNFCRQMGHDRATAWQVEGGQQTLVLGSGQICGPSCDALRDVVCVGGSALTPAGRLIRVLQATYGGNCGVPQGNATAHIAAQCDGQAQCAYTIDFRVIGDPAVGCAKDYVVSWTCDDGQTRTERVAPEAGGRRQVTLACPSGGGMDAVPAAAGTWQLNANGWAGRLVLEWTGSGWTGSMHYDNLGRTEPLEAVRFDPATGQIEMTRPIPNYTQIYRGTLRGDRFEGQFNQGGGAFVYNWTATR